MALNTELFLRSMVNLDQNLRNCYEFNFLSLFLNNWVILFNNCTCIYFCLHWFVGWFMVFNATFNNISVISWLSFIGGRNRRTGENHRLVTSHWQTLSCNVVL